jgi:hypothetical protein
VTTRGCAPAIGRRRSLATAGVLAAGGAGAICVQRGWPRAADADRAWPEWREA